MRLALVARMTANTTAEQARLVETREKGAPWRKWGPYVSERQWGTVREDYSDNGDAWNYLNHEQARSRAYHWGEDGLAGFSDDQQVLCFALALWNGKDPILKERLFGLSNGEGNHGEDVKEYYFYIDATPTHSYLKWLYKYPQEEYPYNDIVTTNRQRSREEFEYELMDTGVFRDNRYFDVFVEYAKASPEDILIKIRAVNRGPDAATLHVLPTLWFRNTWTFWSGSPKPELHRAELCNGFSAITATHTALGQRFLYVDGDAELLFTENETNNRRLFGGDNAGPYVKDGINDRVVSGSPDTTNPQGFGTKAAAHRRIELGPGESLEWRLRLTNATPASLAEPFSDFDRIMETRRAEADEFYSVLTPPSSTPDQAMVIRQALSGMIWTKQFYLFDVDQWLAEHGIDPLGERRRYMRNVEWGHMMNAHVISMPDKWEYPWFAAWDLAFHAIAMASVDLDFAKGQLELMLRESYLHPNAQIPAYEWNFGDVNPPVHAWATIFIHRMEQALQGPSDVAFLKRSFGKLMSNFTWWVNRKDRYGKNVFEGGFLGLDNIGVFDRSAPLPTGGCLEQADGTAWVALFCQNMLEIAAEIATEDPTYEDLAPTFIDHFLSIANAMNRIGDSGMWDEEDGFYYDVLRFPDGQACRLKVRSMVGLLPLCATTIIEPKQRERMPRLFDHFQSRIRRHPELLRAIHATGPGRRGCGDRGIMALVDEQRLRRILAVMLDENEFLSPHGIRSLSRVYLEHPYEFRVNGTCHRVNYLPAESDSSMFGGNSNWRGPVWMPVNVLLIRALLMFYSYYGEAFQIECPTGSGRYMSLFGVTQEIVRRLASIFLRDENGRRPVFGGIEPFQNDPHFRDLLLFHEYFHGDNGAGIGASHQTGWSGLIALLLQYFQTMTPERLLATGASLARYRA